jgi:hypothetical protein
MGGVDQGAPIDACRAYFFPGERIGAEKDLPGAELSLKRVHRRRKNRAPASVKNF